LKIHPATVSTVVVLSGIPGVIGLVIGRRLADRRGRRLAVAIGVVATAVTSLLAYSGGVDPFIAGYLLGVFAGGVFAPGGAAIATEPFPRSVRASAGGWIVVAAVLGALAGIGVFCAVADATNSTAWASVAAFLPGLLVLLLLPRLPETKGLALT
jgi:MFS family permease